MVKQLTDLKVTVPIGIIGAVIVIAWRADNLTVGYLSEWFVTKVEAQGLASKVAEVEGKVDNLSEKIDAARVADLERLIFEARIQACMSTGSLRTLYASQLADLVGQWRALTRSTGDPPTLVRCEDLG